MRCETYLDELHLFTHVTSLKNKPFRTSLINLSNVTLWQTLE